MAVSLAQFAIGSRSAIERAGWAAEMAAGVRRGGNAPQQETVDKNSIRRRTSSWCNSHGSAPDSRMLRISLHCL